MNEIEEMIQRLYGTNANDAYAALKVLLQISEDKNAVYPYFNEFAEMMESDNSYVRTRGLLLISANAKWDVDNKMDEVIDEYLKHIIDAKPITARQCIKAIPDIVKYKPDLKDLIIEELGKANPYWYPDTMQPLVRKDIANVLKEIQNNC